MISAERRHDIDWLRVIAIGLLLIYHITIGFQPWGILIGFIQSDTSLESLWPPMAMLNVWRIPLLFYVSGMGVCFAIRKRNWQNLLLERTKRIFVPFVFGVLTIVPLHVFIWQRYYSYQISYVPNPGHLWFLGNIFIYVIVLLPVFFYLKKHANGKVAVAIKKTVAHPLGWLLIMAAFVVEAQLVNPYVFEMYTMTWHGFFLGLLAFFVGFCCVFSGDQFWKMIVKWRFAFLALAVALYAVRLILFQLKAPYTLMSMESNLWIFAVLAFGHKYLNRPSRALSYLSQGAYPIYILHMVFLYLGSLWLFPLAIATSLKFILLVAFTMVGCLITYDLLIRRVNLLRPLFGLKKSL